MSRPLDSHRRHLRSHHQNSLALFAAASDFVGKGFGGRLLQVGLATLVCLSTGCHQTYSRPYGYGGYGCPPEGCPPAGSYPAGSYPAGAYPAPIQTLTPGQPYVPGGMTPSGATPTYQAPNSGLQPIPDNSAPSYAPNTSPLAPSPYMGPGASLPPASSSTLSGIQQVSGVQPVGGVQPLGAAQPLGGVQPTPLNPPMAALRQIPAQPLSTVTPATSSQYSPVPAVQPVQPIHPATAAKLIDAISTQQSQSAAASSDTFMAPVNSPPAAVPVSSSTTSAEPWSMEVKKVEQASLTPFGHDAKFRWLRGVVSQDPKDGSWGIVYNDAPGKDDRWGGHLSLTMPPDLIELRDGDTVHVQGRVDTVANDGQGKPVYVVSHAQKFNVVE